MDLPRFDDLTLPILRLVADGEEQRLKEVHERMADQFDLSEEQRGALLPSGTQTVFYNRVVWACTYIVKAGLLERPRRGHLRIPTVGDRS